MKRRQNFSLMTTMNLFSDALHPANVGTANVGTLRADLET